MKLKQPYKDLLPPLSTDELEALKADIKANGVLHPVVIDEDGNILDGHHRYSIDNGAPTITKEGLTVTQKRAFVIRANFVRRNLSPNQKREIHQAQKALAKELKAEDKKNTQASIAATLGVARSTVGTWLDIPNANTGKGNKTETLDSRVKVGTKAKEEIAARVESGETQSQVAADFGIAQSQVSKIAKAKAKIHERDNDKARKTAHLKSQVFEVRKGDFREVLKDVSGVSLVLTDPPYPKDSLPLWSDLAEWASTALADDGLLVAYSGQLYLPDVLNRCSEHLRYWWCGAVAHKGSGNLTPLSHPVRKVINQWKPLVMFYKPGGCGFERTFHDLVTGVGPEKDHHNWQQPVAEAAAIVEMFTKNGELVVDPFAGSGGFCKAANDLGRTAIGAEIL